MANRFTRYLGELLPRTGRLIRENGKEFNEADFLEVKQREEISSQSLLGNGFAASWRGTIAAGATTDLVLEIPAGVKVYVHARDQTIVGGQLEWELLLNPDPGYTEVDRIFGVNLDHEINSQSQASIVEATGVTGGQFLREGILYPAGTGANQSTAVVSTADAIPQYVNGAEPVLRLNNANAGEMLIVVTFIWAELPQG